MLVQIRQKRAKTMAETLQLLHMHVNTYMNVNVTLLCMQVYYTYDTLQLPPHMCVYTWLAHYIHNVSDTLQLSHDMYSCIPIMCMCIICMVPCDYHRFQSRAARNASRGIARLQERLRRNLVVRIVCVTSVSFLEVAAHERRENQALCARCFVQNACPSTHNDTWWYTYT